MSLTELKYYTSKGCLSVYMSVFYQNEFYTPLHYRLANVKKLITMNTTSLIKEIIIMPKSQITGPQCHLSNVDELILSNMSKNSLKIQPIPPFLHRICSKDNLTHMKSNSTTYSYDYLKKTLDLSIPYTEEDLRSAAMKSERFLTAHTSRNRSEFYTADPQYKSFKSPILMDGFSYCEESTLIVEVIFNLKYMDAIVENRRVFPGVNDTWLCVHHGITVQNKYPLDPRNHVIIAVFKFSDQCLTANDHHYEIRAVNHKYFYSLNLEFLPYFHVPRYYLSMCIFLSKAIEQQVIAFINYYYFHGIQHFVFNINYNLGYWRKYLKEYSDHGIVDIIDFEFPNKRAFNEQQVVMNSCNRRYRFATQFMIQCDVDEFMLPLNPKWRIVDVVRLYSSVYPNMDAFSVILL